MKKLKIALAAVALTVVAGGTYASQAKKTLDPCQGTDFEICTGNQADCCELPLGGTLKFVIPQQ